MSQQALRAAPAEGPADRRKGWSGAVHHTISAQSPPLATRARELWQARDLFVLLLGREVRVRYRQTALGVGWVVLQPLVPALIVAVVLGRFASLPSAGAPYLLFALSGFVLFGLFASAVSRAATSYLRDGQLVARIYFPRSILPLAGGSAAVVDFGVALGLLLVLVVAFGKLVFLAVVLVPVIAALTLLLALAVGLAIAAVSAHYRDAAIAVPFALQLLLYASPVVYSTELVPVSVRPLYALNPLVPLLEAFRAALLGTPWPSTGEIASGTITGVVAAGLAIVVFVRASRDLADVI